MGCWQRVRSNRFDTEDCGYYDYCSYWELYSYATVDVLLEDGLVASFNIIETNGSFALGFDADGQELLENDSTFAVASSE